MKMTPAAALNLLRKAIAADRVRVTAHARAQAEAAGYDDATLADELRLAAARGTVGRNDSNPSYSLAYGVIFAISFGRDGEGNQVVVVTAFVMER